MRNPVRKFLGTALIGLLGVFVAAPAIAGAQTTAPIPGDGVGQCTYIVPTTVAATGDQVQVTGSAPGGVTVQLFVNNSVTPTAQQVLPGTSATTQPFSFTFTVTTSPTVVSVNYLYGGTGEAAGNSYVAGCSNGNVSGEVVTRITVQTAGEVVARPLAFTGSNNTPTYVLIGVGAVVVGLVLMVAARRRSRVHT